MTVLLCIFCFIFASVCFSTTAQEIEVCVSYGGPELQELFINVEWNFSDDEVNIMFEDVNGITSGNYNESSAIDIPLRLRADQDTVNVTVCGLNTSSCYSFITVTDPIYNATWTRVNDTTLEFTCEVACRTPAITGCRVGLEDNSDSSNTLSGTSFNVNGSDEDISSRFVTILVTDVDPTVEWTFTATPVPIVNGQVIALNGFMGIIPAAVKASSTVEQMSPTTTGIPSVTTSDMLDATSTGTSTTTLSTTSTSVPISTTATSDMSTPSSSVITEATDDQVDDDDDDEYLPVIIAASCACVLLLIVAIILLIIIIRVKRRGPGSNLSSPSASKVNNYDDLGDVRYFPMLDSQSNMQKSESPPSDTQNQEPQITKASGYEFPVFTSVEQTPQITTSHDLLNANDPKYDSPDGVLNPKTQSNDSPVDPLYDPLSLNSVAQRDDALRSPVVEYDKLNHSPTPQPTNQFTSSIYDTLTEKNLRAHYEFPDKNDENETLESKTQLRRIASGNGDEYTVPQTKN